MVPKLLIVNINQYILCIYIYISTLLYHINHYLPWSTTQSIITVIFRCCMYSPSTRMSRWKSCRLRSSCRRCVCLWHLRVPVDRGKGVLGPWLWWTWKFQLSFPWGYFRYFMDFHGKTMENQPWPWFNEDVLNDYNVLFSPMLEDWHPLPEGTKGRLYHGQPPNLYA